MLFRSLWEYIDTKEPGWICFLRQPFSLLFSCVATARDSTLQQPPLTRNSPLPPRPYAVLPRFRPSCALPPLAPRLRLQEKGLLSRAAMGVPVLFDLLDFAFAPREQRREAAQAPEQTVRSRGSQLRGRTPCSPTTDPQWRPSSTLSRTCLRQNHLNWKPEISLPGYEIVRLPQLNELKLDPVQRATLAVHAADLRHTRKTQQSGSGGHGIDWARNSTL